MALVQSEGATLSIGGTVGQVTSLSISHTRDTIEVSNLDTAGGKAFLGAKLYEAELSADVQYDFDDTGQAAILDDFDGAGTSAEQACVLTFSDSSFTFQGLVTSFEITGSLDSVVTASVSVKVTDEITQAADS
jgi:predicted secreted protein